MLGPGARVAVTAPASPAPRETIEAGIERLRRLGFEVVVGASCGIHEGVWAGPDASRARELREFLLDPSIGAIFAARGGVGCTRLLELLEDLPQGTPPCWIVGRSDLTALHLFFWGRFGWTGLSGPMIATDLGGGAPEPLVTRMLRILRDPLPLGAIGGHDPRGSAVAHPLATWRGGSAEGPLIPANLSLLCSLVGTRFLPSLRGAILVLEEIDEPPQRVDRMLTQMRSAGALDGLAGLVLGQFTNCVPRDGASGAEALAAVLHDHVDCLGVPSIAGFPYGHEKMFQPLPVGLEARIETDPPCLTLLEGTTGTAHEAPSTQGGDE